MRRTGFIGILFYNSNIKCVDFEPIHYAINLDVVSSSMVFSEFDYISINVLLI